LLQHQYYLIIIKKVNSKRISIENIGVSFTFEKDFELNIKDEKLNNINIKNILINFSLV
jgi:hypothetical protein